MKKRVFAIVITLLLTLSLLTPLSAGGLAGPKPPEGPADTADVCGTSPDRTGGPDIFGYTFRDSAEPNGPVYSWVDISTTGTNIPFTDDDYWGPYALGFNFNYYGTDYANVYASSNGWASVVAPTSSYLTNDCPMPGSTAVGVIAGVWDDLDQNTAVPDGTGYYQAYAAGACPWGGYTGACFIVEWAGMYHYGSAGDNMWFEHILFDNGNIVTQFQDASNELGSGSSTGIQAPGASVDGLTYACNTAASLADNLAIQYYYPPAAPRLDQSSKTAPASIYTGEDILYTIVVNNTGFAAATGTTLVDPIPTGATYVAGSVTGGATYNSGSNQIEFAGDVPARTALNFTFLATATATSGNIVNTATISQTQIAAPVVVQATTAASAVPAIVVDPLSLESAQATNVVRTLPMTIDNDGYADLNWEIGELANTKSPDAVIYDNGPLVTHPGGGAGGLDASALQTALGMNTYGAGNQLSAGNRVADDFVVDAAGGWQIDTITFYGYQTGSGTTSTMNHVNVRIWDGNPNDPGSTVVWGDTTTNRLASTAFSNIYRVLDTALTNTDRPIMTIVATVGTLLPPGTYWVDWQVGGTGASGPWAPAISILGQTTTGNAWQYTSTGWAALTDSGTLTPQGLPFTVDGTAFNCMDDIPWISASPISGTLAPAGTQPIDVTFDSTGLADGTYTGNLCVASDDPDDPMIMVPVTLTVRPPTAATVTGLVAAAPSALPIGLAALFALGLTGAVIALRRRR